MKNENLAGGQELVCINTEQVYDWIINDATFDINITAAGLVDIVDCESILVDDITCTVTPAEEGAVEEIDREDRTFNVDGTDITLQVITLRKNFDVLLEIPYDVDGTVEVEEFLRTYSRSEQVILYAPETTDIEIDFTNEECFIVSFDCFGGDVDPVTFDAVISVRLCQSIQAVYDVTLELVADLCQPREELILPTGTCPAPVVPEQSQLFPTNGNGDNGNGVG
ncbi:hypothetical protein [Aquisalibacillus elongatus]|uniref:Uncharacterized protein n=1 Tax=Aquisalibacillus elongatus TaxID=485577 RepID=A0A3N5C6U4_9BACI|nr:hypothetical protein [Aquisalibacillus elongatus]RPF52151.1 hypothetical protein EDC24_2141 [Aquisalibacillus elongatus]